MKIDFTDQTVLITGGTRGIGKQIAYDMISAGANLIITGTNVEPVLETNENYYPRQPIECCVDFLDDDSTNKFIDFIAEKNIDVCINNAGINKIAPVCDIEDIDWADIMKVNLTAPYRILKTVAKNMKKQRYGRIVNISSIWGTIGAERRVSYSASKFGLRGLTLSSAAELARYNVLVNTISPGFTLTDLTRRILGDEEIENLSKQIPMRRMAEPKDISNAVLFVASKMNTYISGQNIIVDGGFVNV